MADAMTFPTLRAALAYVHAMSDADAIAIAAYEVWQFDSGMTIIVEPGADMSDAEEDDAILLGTVDDLD